MIDADLDRAVLLLVDVQQDFLARPGLSPCASEVIEGLQALLEGWRARARPVLHVRTLTGLDGQGRMPHWQRQDIRACVAGSPGYEPPRQLAALPGETVLHKSFFSAFGCAELASELQRLGAHTLVVAGLYTHGCIRATVADGYERGFEMLVAEGAIGSTEPVHAELSRGWLEGRAARFLPNAVLLAATTHDPIDKATIGAACRIAASAGQVWADSDPAARAALLERWAARLEDDGDTLTALLAREIGKPLADGRDELRRTLAHIRFAATLARAAFETSPAPGVQVRYRPVGTIALITPWNNPLAIPAGKLAPALAFGNSCVWKPSPRAPDCSAQLHCALVDAGLPGGVVERVEGDAGVARQIVSDPHIDAVSVTGSRSTGHTVAALCAPHHKPLQAELGGNNAALILNDWTWDDGDMRTLAMSVFGFAGQRCTALRRLIVERGVLDRFTVDFAASVRALRIGDPLDPASQLGPLISREHRAAVEAAVQAAITGGARVIAQASLPADLDDGRWLAPTLLGDVDPGARIAREETFGPVASIFPADDLDHAIALANTVPQGLVAALYSNDPAARTQLARRAESGMLKLSPGPLRIAAEAPFTGWKASAIGPPEHGLWDRDFYARVQTIYV